MWTARAPTRSKLDTVNVLAIFAMGHQESMAQCLSSLQPYLVFLLPIPWADSLMLAQVIE